VELLDQSFEAGAWHGSSARQAVRSLSVEAALWRPAPRAHNIWELVLHMAYWAHVGLVRLTKVRQRFPRPGRDWIPLPKRRDQTAWRQDVELLVDRHSAFRAAVQRFPASQLWTKRGAYRAHQLIEGIAAHHLHHTGQIQLIRRLAKLKT